MSSGKGMNSDHMSSPKNCSSKCLPEGACWRLPGRHTLLEQPPDLDGKRGEDGENVVHDRSGSRWIALPSHLSLLHPPMPPNREGARTGWEWEVRESPCCHFHCFVLPAAPPARCAMVTPLTLASASAAGPSSQCSVPLLLFNPQYNEGS